MDKCVDVRTAFAEDIPELWRYSMHLRTGEVQAVCLTPDARADFPTVPDEHVSLRTRYCYAAGAHHTKAMCASH
jgi:carotenoid cleavage dioxygenase-like enzyme